MPCSYYTDSEEKAIAEAETRKVKAELDVATRLLCEMLRKYGAHTRELTEWKDQHDAMDRARTESEQNALAAQRAREDEEQRRKELVQTAKSKLSAEELAALLRSG
jgi:carbamoylphosphate synthase small subunit